MYVAEGLDQLILSREACESLGLIEKNFPAIGSYGNTPTRGGGEVDDELAGGNCNLLKHLMQVEEDLLTPCIPGQTGHAAVRGGISRQDVHLGSIKLVFLDGYCTENLRRTKMDCGF